MSSFWRLLEGQPRFGLNAGDVLECVAYSLDPSKLSVLRRVTDNYEPRCNVYRRSVEAA